jgi:cell division protein FtsI/penicillin-binding protein 2
MDRKRVEAFASIPQKANRILHVVLLGLMVIGLRIWYLTVVQHDARVLGASHARRHLVIEPAMRGTIRDRFHVVLAANAIEYRVGIVWPPIQEIPRKIIENGQKRLLRKEYVKALAKMVGKAIDMDPLRIEDTIYSYAVFSQTTPVVLKAGLTERQYYQLNIAAKDWPGLVVERAPKRVYPRGRSGCHVVGYTAPLSRQEFDRAVAEIRVLKDYVGGIERGEEKELPFNIPSFFAAKERLMALERRAYGLNDEIGKMGIEAAFEGQLRGLAGKKYFITNAFGEILREAAGSREPVPGKRLVLSISSELQSWCEKLLAQSEVDRYNRLERDAERLAKGAKNPFIRGGAIVAIDPRTAEVVACASYPRFDPNDFVRPTPSASHRILCQKASLWLEGETYIQKIWDLEWPMVREEADDKEITDKNIWMTWEQFLKIVLPAGNPALQLLPPQLSVSRFLKLQEDMRENLILVDLTRLLVRREELSEALVGALGPLSIDALRYLISAKVAFSDALQHELGDRFQKGPFQEWRGLHGTEFLAEKRKEEKASGIAPRPFLQYLEKECSLQFSAWWKEYGDSVLLSAFSLTGASLPDWVQQGTKQCVATFSHVGFQKARREGLLLLSSLLKKLSPKEGLRLFSALKGFDGLMHPLLGKYSSTVRGGPPSTAQDLIRSFLSLRSSPLASFCHMQPSAQGSLFKLVVAYAALHQQLQRLHGEEAQLRPNFFHMTDQTFHASGRVFVGLDSSGKPIPQLYKGGRLPKSVEANLGELDLIHAIGRSSNPYFSLLASEFLSSPQVLVDAAKNLGFGEKTGIALPSESAGRFPVDLDTNRTGLYTTAIGQHTMLATPLQSSVMLSALATCGDMVIPRLVKMAIGPEVTTSRQLRDSLSFPGRELMRAVGVDVPIWLAQTADINKHHIQVTTRRTKRHVEMTEKERDVLFDGMLASIEHTMQDHNLPRLFAHRPSLLQALHGMKGQMIGKSSTAESYERLGAGVGQKPYMYNHTWFGGIFFPESISGRRPFDNRDAELIVVVFLRYGTFGKDAAPLAASVASEWRAIQRRRGVYMPLL